MDTLIGLRIKMKFGDPDPGMGSGFKLPDEAVYGIVSGSYLGPHGRIWYYVTLDQVLELDAESRSVRVEVNADPGKWLTDPRKGLRRRTNVVSLATSRGLPPQDLLGPTLLELGHGHAELADLIFKRLLASRVDLSECQQDSRRPLEEADYVGIGYADVEVVRLGA